MTDEEMRHMDVVEFLAYEDMRLIMEVYNIQPGCTQLQLEKAAQEILDSAQAEGYLVYDSEEDARNQNACGLRRAAELAEDLRYEMEKCS